MYCKKCGKETEAGKICWECLKKEYTEKQSQNPETENAETEKPLPDGDGDASKKAFATKKRETRSLAKAIVSVLLGAIGFAVSCYTGSIAGLLRYASEEMMDDVSIIPMLAALLIVLALDVFIVLTTEIISLVTGVMSVRTFCLNVERETVATVILGIIGTLFAIVAFLMLTQQFTFVFTWIGALVMLLA